MLEVHGSMPWCTINDMPQLETQDHYFIAPPPTEPALHVVMNGIEAILVWAYKGPLSAKTGHKIVQP